MDDKLNNFQVLQLKDLGFSVKTYTEAFELFKSYGYEVSFHEVNGGDAFYYVNSKGTISKYYISRELMLKDCLEELIEAQATVSVSPFVKWAGGKRQLLDKIDALLPNYIKENKPFKYREYFVGGGAVLFHLLNKYPNMTSAVIVDNNSDLINTYAQIKNNCEELIEKLFNFESLYNNHSNQEQFYKEVRDEYNNSENLSEVERATMFIFLNKTCFNGLYRVNKKGKFNVPWGKREKVSIFDEQNIRNISRLLNEKKVLILCEDYKEVIYKARYSVVREENTFCYFDPPYLPVSDTSDFTAYTKEGFGKEETDELFVALNFLNTTQTVDWMLSNSDTEYTRTSLEDYDIQTVSARRNINSDGNKRGKINELIIRNYE
nr:MAG TPA: Cytosine specific methyltransferase [Bacteriophage sp.]